MQERLVTAPEVAAGRLFYDILVFDPAALRYLIDFVGPTQILVGSDYPFLKIAPEWPLTEVALDAQLLHQIRSTNARRFLGLHPA
jgi:aminocarboxymuconate-semialdehyde decarboxylase